MSCEVGLQVWRQSLEVQIQTSEVQMQSLEVYKQCSQAEMQSLEVKFMVLQINYLPVTVISLREKNDFIYETM